jgi:membrane protein
LTDLAAALTYYAVLSIVPGLLVLISVLGLLGPNITTEVGDQVQAIAPGSSANFVHTLITQAQADKGGAGLTSTSGITKTGARYETGAVGSTRPSWRCRCAREARV